MPTQVNSDTLQIENLTRKPVWVRLNSGDHLNVYPRTRSAPVPKNEIENNERVRKLVELAVIRLHSAEAAGQPQPAKTAQLQQNEVVEKADQPPNKRHAGPVAKQAQEESSRSALSVDSPLHQGGTQ
ncbi:MAG: hypothetical protein U1F76_31285 [Candidatus Competibacteraceae bacterium]